MRRQTNVRFVAGVDVADFHKATARAFEEGYELFAPISVISDCGSIELLYATFVKYAPEETTT